jgi:biotin synthase
MDTNCKSLHKNNCKFNKDFNFKKKDFNLNDIITLLSSQTPEELTVLYNQAYTVKSKFIGKIVHLRGIIEFSNLCTRDCFYCGIRKSNKNVNRFRLNKDNILRDAQWIYDNNYGSVVLQSGERDDKEFIIFVEDILKEIKKIGNGALGITISLGEQTKETYERWFNAGAHRYLLRIESSKPELFNKIHPQQSSFKKRIKCLNYLKESGYQVGTGVMIGLPEQTIEDLANDILFFKQFDIDMIGMGPFIPHHDTPMGKYAKNFNSKKQLQLGLKMIAATRIVLKDVNIAAATALQALNPDGRELGLKAGANIIMPNVTPTEYRASYQLYDNKPNLNENSDQTRNNLEEQIFTLGESINYGEWGDAIHFHNRIKKD